MLAETYGHRIEVKDKWTVVNGAMYRNLRQSYNVTNPTWYLMKTKNGWCLTDKKVVPKDNLTMYFKLSTELFIVDLYTLSFSQNFSTYGDVDYYELQTENL
ncbi:hypothetical protein RF11_12463 [Thelohanellus kitauei]|uniref:Uncharacterized protein n=1 Tax=Thelohanellus kitauei TaxID=669202 RepID=A0A0C2J5I7_THEKT|nr:hypothetical protein RF11_12463 [Thelohanellus kitauei]